MLKEVLRCN